MALHVTGGFRCVSCNETPDDQPFTAPIITPLLKYFCRNGYNTSNGNVDTMITPYLIWFAKSRCCTTSMPPEL